MNDNPFEEFENSLSEKVAESATELDTLQIEAIEREQRWKKRRIGKITSSNLDKLMNFSKDGRIKTKAGIDYLLEIKHQLETGCESEYASAPAMRWGSSYEQEAHEYYRKETGIDMVSGATGFGEILFIDDIIKGFGDSPDGKSADGIVEYKCPYNGANHLRNCALNMYSDSEDYFWQCIGHMIDPKVQWCDFVSYDPRYPDGHPNKIKIIRINRADIAGKITQLEEKLKLWIEVLKNGNLIDIFSL